MPALIISSYLIRHRGAGPRRFLEPTTALEPAATLLVEKCYDTDEAYEATPQRGDLTRRLSGALKLLLQNHHLIRSSSTLCCLDGLHFNLLLMLAQAKLLSTRGKVIRRYAFRDRALLRLAPWLKRAPAGFGIDYITHDQVQRGTALVGKNRVHLLPWKVDTEWYQPNGEVAAADAPLFLPGNAHRKDEMVFPLLAAGHHVTRAGRPGKLTEVFAKRPLNAGFDLLINRGHPEYREHLQSARAVVLPIEPCDEPAGLTAAMEAIACEVPLITNRSMGVSELLEECEYPIPAVPDLEPATWLAAIAQVDLQRTEPNFRAALTRSRARLVASRGMLPDHQDWLAHLAKLQPRGVS